jgi:hypothetical protein
MNRLPKCLSDRDRLFHILRENLVLVQPEYEPQEVILCPICLRKLRIDELGSVEHIVAQNLLKSDPWYMKKISLSRRAGLTALCRHSRLTATGETAKHGCNGWKGQKYDLLFKGMLQGREIRQEELLHRHGVAVLVMAYLAAFQRLGYGYILRLELDQIRQQFDHPDQRKTAWLDHARVNLAPVDPNYQPWGTTSGLPFLFGGQLTSTAPLEVFFRRFHALLPSGHWAVKNNPKILLDPVLPPPTNDG